MNPMLYNALLQGLGPVGMPISPQLQGYGELGGLLRPGGGYSTEIGITVTDPRLNGGKPTNIPLLVQGQKDIESLLMGAEPTDEQQEIAILRAHARTKGLLGIQWPSFETIDEAVQASMAHSQRKNGMSGGMGR